MLILNLAIRDLFFFKVSSFKACSSVISLEFTGSITSSKFVPFVESVLSLEPISAFSPISLKLLFSSVSVKSNSSSENSSKTVFSFKPLSLLSLSLFLIDSPTLSLFKNLKKAILPS